MSLYTMLFCFEDSEPSDDGHAVKRLSVRVNAAAAAFREVYAHVLYQPGGRGAQEACESFQEGCESSGRCL